MLYYSKTLQSYLYSPCTTIFKSNKLIKSNKKIISYLGTENIINKIYNLIILGAIYGLEKK